MSDGVLFPDDLYTLLYEECAEVIKGATKCQRFGPSRFYPGYGVNKDVLAAEFGDLLGVMDAFQNCFELDPAIIKKARETKIDRAMKAKKEIGYEHGPLPRNIRRSAKRLGDGKKHVRRRK